MSIKDREVPFSITRGHDAPRSFTGIKELGFDSFGSFIVFAWTTAPGTPRGSYLGSIPISPTEYRRKNSTDAAFSHSGENLTLYDDWGKRRVITAPKDIIDALVAECIAHEIPPRTILRKSK